MHVVSPKAYYKYMFCKPKNIQKYMPRTPKHI